MQHHFETAIEFTACCICGLLVVHGLLVLLASGSLTSLLLLYFPSAAAAAVRSGELQLQRVRQQPDGSSSSPPRGVCQLCGLQPALTPDEAH
jgi:hypothetical protein